MRSAIKTAHVLLLWMVCFPLCLACWTRDDVHCGIYGVASPHVVCNMNYGLTAVQQCEP